MCITVLGLIVSVCLSSALAKHSCTAPFVPCHPDAAIIMAMLSEFSFRELMSRDIKVGVKENERNMLLFIVPMKWVQFVPRKHVGERRGADDDDSSSIVVMMMMIVSAPAAV